MNRVVALAGLVLVVIILRLIVAFQTGLPDVEAYDALRQVDSVISKGVPLYDDPLSLGGRARVFPPLFHYIMALGGLFLSPIMLIKVLPNVFAALVCIPVFYVTRYVTDKESFSYISAFMAGIVPAAFFHSVNDGSSFGLALTLMMTALYLFLRCRNSGQHLNWLIAVLIVLSLMNSFGVVLLFVLLLYLAILKIERLTIRPKEVEVLLFFFFFSGWLSLIIYKRALIAHGSSVIWQNIPLAELSLRFSQITLLEAVVATGLVPLVLGVAGLYIALTRTQKKSAVLLFSLGLVSAVFLWFRFIPLSSGLALLTVCLIVMTGYSLSLMFEYVRKTKVPWSAYLVVGVLLAGFVAVSLPLSLQPDHDVVSADTIAVLDRGHLSGEVVIMGVPQDGFLIEYYGASSVIDLDYLLAPRIEERYDDVVGLYAKIFKTQAISVMQKYGATHLLVSERSALLTGVDSPRFIDDACFSLVASSGASSLYELRCSVRGEFE